MVELDPKIFNYEGQMRLPNLKGLTGTTITLLLSTVYPAFAVGGPQPLSDRPQQPEQLISQSNNMRRMIRGTIATVAGNNVTLQLPNGETQTLSVTSSDIERLNLRPGMEIVVTMDNSSMFVQSVVIVQQNPNSTAIPGIEPAASPLTSQTQPLSAEAIPASTSSQEFSDNEPPIRALW